MKKTLFKLVAVVFSTVLFFSSSALAESPDVEVLEDDHVDVVTSLEDIESEGPVIKPKKELKVEEGTPIFYWEYFDFYDENTAVEDLIIELMWDEPPVKPGVYQAIVSAENEEGKKTVEYFDFEILEASAEEGNKNPSKPVIKQIKELVAEVNTPIDFFDYFEIYDENTPFDELFYEFGWLELPLTPGVYKVEARVKNNDGVETVEYYDFKIVESLDELEEETEKEVEKETSKEDKKDSEKESSETKELPKAGTSSLGLPMLGLGVILKLISGKQ